MEAFKRELFVQLGNFFFAVATERGITELQWGELKLMLTQDWLSETRLSRDQVPEAAHVIGITIDNLRAGNVSAEEACTSFETYYADHHELFSDALKQRILQATDFLEEAFPEGSDNACSMRMRSMLSAVQY